MSEVKYPWQATEVARAGTPKWGILAAPRTGKTLVGTELLQVWGGRGVVVAPLVVCPQWHRKLEAAGMPVNPMYKQITDRSGIVVVNYDRLSRAMPLLERANTLILDEAHYIKSPSAVRARLARQLAWQTPHVRLLTGTPSPNNYGDLWGQLVAIDRKAWGSYTAFKRRYLVTDPVWPSRIVAYRNEDELLERLAGYTSIYRREDVFGPDTWQVIEREVSLPLNARGLYQRMKTESVVPLGEDEQKLAAPHLFTRAMRLHQIACGFLPLPSGGYQEVHTAVVDAVEADLIEIAESGMKAVIVCRYRWEVDRYTELCKRYGTTFRVAGDTPIEQREKAEIAMATLAGPLFIVGQVKALGIGISLKDAEFILFPSRDWDWAADMQARDRIYSPGAVRTVIYYQAINTVAVQIAKALARKEDAHRTLENINSEH